jgi:2-polyprenyl-3-methyl-5-hydroxy-6-metoxy-1,4-benzoquinol methylase
MTQLEQRTWSPAGQDLREVACNLCGSALRRLLAEENGLAVVRCRACGLVYVTPQPTAEELARFYEAYYAEDSEQDWYRIMIHAFHRDAQRLEARLGRPGRLLDIGTGFGHFLDLMRQRGWEVTGVESSAVATRRLEQKGIPVFAGRVPEVKLPEAHFDAVTASSVLEHVADPLAVLEQARGALRPGGWMLARVPNVGLLSAFFVARRFERVAVVRAALRVLRREIMDEDNLFHVIDPPAHLFGFTGRTLNAALERAGFHDVEIVGDRMPTRGNALNAAIDGGVYRIAETLRWMSAGRVQLAPNITALGRRPLHPPQGSASGV